MPHPSLLKLGVITCVTTNDVTGSDDLVGVLGADRFSIGEFNAGDSIDVGIEMPIAPDVTELTIIEVDTVFDDPLITIDLTRDMDVDRMVGILTDGARYTVSFLVVSEPDQ